MGQLAAVVMPKAIAKITRGRLGLLEWKRAICIKALEVYASA
jgi:hypothetical protein